MMMAAVVGMFIIGRNGITVDFFYMTDHGISVTGIDNYVIYYAVIILLTVPALLHGRRAACHYICWMAPFMIMGSRMGRALHLPQLHVEVDSSRCISCKRCNSECPMGLDVAEMVKQEKNSTSPECILYGACIDHCPGKCLHYHFEWKGSAGKE